MTKSTRAQKVVLGVIVGVVAAIIGGVWINSMVEESQLKTAQAQAQIAVDSAQMNDRLHESQLELVGTAIGPTAEAQLRVCFFAGYPANQGTYNNLSRREVAVCNAILAKLEKSENKEATAKAKLDATYDRQHPVSK